MFIMKQIYNPYLPMGEYVPDGEPHVFGDRVYLYGSHDKFGSFFYCNNDYVLYSAPITDLTQWKCHGVIYHKNDDPWNAKGRSQLWAPDVQKGVDGRFYLYYCCAFKPWIGVAVSSSPAGPFHYYGHVHYEDGIAFGQKENDAAPFDPAVLTDADGHVYLYTGFGPVGNFPIPGKLQHDGCYCVELETDMVTIKRKPELIVPDVHHSAGSGFEGHEFYEASSICRFGDKYYFVYSSINGHELCYATSNHPDRGFVYRGILISNGDIGFEGRKAEDAVYYTANNHGGIEAIDGKYYIFYHRQTNFCQTARQGCAEELTQSSDGLFRQAEMTSCGLNGRVLDGSGTYPAYIACALSSKDGCVSYPFLRPAFLRPGNHPYITQKEKDGEVDACQFITNLCNGSTVGYKYFDFSQTKSIQLKISGKAEGYIEILSKINGLPIAKVPITKGANCRILKSALHISGKRSALYFRMQGKGRINLYAFFLGG